MSVENLPNTSNALPVSRNLSGAPDKSISLDLPANCLIEDGVARCRNCRKVFGNVERRDLIGGEVILTNRTTFRCRNCYTKNIWEPQFPRKA